MIAIPRLLLALVASGPSSEPDGAAAIVPAPAPAAAPVAQLRRCQIEYLRTTELGAADFGVLEELNVERGDRVKAGDVLGHLIDDDAQIERDMLIYESKSDIEIRILEAQRDQAASKLRSSEQLVRRDAMSAEEFNLRRLEALTAELAVEEAQFKHGLDELRLERAEALLRRRQFIAPHDGVVVEVYGDPGESIGPNEPVVRIVDVSRVRVTGHLDVRDAWRVQTGQPIRLTPDVGGADLDVEGRWFDGVLTFIDPQIDLQTQTCQVIAEVPNTDQLLRAGLEARMEILPFTDDSTAPPAAPDAERAEAPIPSVGDLPAAETSTLD